MGNFLQDLISVHPINHCSAFSYLLLGHFYVQRSKMAMWVVHNVFHAGQGADVEKFFWNMAPCHCFSRTLETAGPGSSSTLQKNNTTNKILSFAVCHGVVTLTIHRF